MYQLKINSEVVADVVPNSYLKTFCRVSHTAEDSLFNDLGVAAIKDCESYLNNYITVKDVTITTNLTEIPLRGKVDQIVSVKLNGTATTDYEVLGSVNKTISLNFSIVETDVIEVNYTTLFNVGENAKIYIAQLVAQMYGRNEDKPVIPNKALVNDLKLLAIC